MSTQRTVLVTGANKGIGYAIAEGLGRRGMRVALGARDDTRRTEAVTALTDAGIDAFGVPLDVTDDESVRAAAATLTGRGSLDVLVNNAGISGGLPQAPGATNPDVLRAVLETNVIGLSRVTDAMLPLLRASDQPRIVNVSSSMGSIAAMGAAAGVGMPMMAAYSPSKAAVNALTVLYARQLQADGILVNAGCPGYVATDFTGHPEGARTPEQGAAIAIRLATLPGDGPTGTFSDDNGSIAW